MNGQRNNLPRPAVALGFGLRFNRAHNAGHVLARVFFHQAQQYLLGIFLCQPRDALQLGHLLFVELFDLGGAPVEDALALVDGPFSIVNTLKTMIQLLLPLLQALLLPPQVNAVVCRLSAISERSLICIGRTSGGKCKQKTGYAGTCRIHGR